MGKQTPKTFSRADVQDIARQQNRMNNPNVSNYFGSTNTTFGPDDQADVTQTMSPELQGIVDSMTNFASQGPAQLGSFSNPFMEQMIQGVSNNIGRRGGFSPGSTQGMGNSYDGSSPVFNPNPMEQMNINNPPPQTMGPTPPSGVGGQDGGFRPTQALGGALSRYGSTGGQINPFGEVGGELARILQEKKRV